MVKTEAGAKSSVKEEEENEKELVFKLALSQETKRPKTSVNPPPTITTPSSSSSLRVETIANNLDILIEILEPLPVRSLSRFKSVSKQWLSIISNPHFCSRRTTQTPPFHNPASGLYLQAKGRELVNLSKFSCPSFRNLSSHLDSSRLYGIVQSCHGLLLLLFGTKYCVYNPTTKSCTFLPSPPVQSGTSWYTPHYNLAFDPSESPHYRVVCVRQCNQEDASSTTFNFRIHAYESKTASWWLSDYGFSAATFRDIDFLRSGTFWNGSIHWMGYFQSLYFNVDEKCVREIPMPEPLYPNWSDMRLEYFGLSGDHLHIVGIYEPLWPNFDVYEMKRDYSGWFVKFSVELEEVPIQFPEMIQKTRVPHEFLNYAYKIICIVRGELDDESYLVLHIPGKIVRYYLKTKTLEVLKHLTNDSYEVCRLAWFNVYQFIESLACTLFDIVMVLVWKTKSDDSVEAVTTLAVFRIDLELINWSSSFKADDAWKRGIAFKA
ncbi:hypothetical protein FNV43_RR21919 [Rhamnella rubrinervis]|uniref:F-box domain-containing protein n=1 Tax=Rhamnella rubrinervis TaxID=2594499 RepID=A0A8K0GMN3_9ROSA|nr:hypothetical protein FNV43_RR21919 [Rhamnella rubrinervis]